MVLDVQAPENGVPEVAPRMVVPEVQPPTMVPDVEGTDDRQR